MVHRCPSYRRHSSGQARVTIRGRDYLLGPYGSPESQERYARLIAEYSANRKAECFGKHLEELRLGQVLLDYMEFTKTYYAHSNEGQMLRLALRPVVRLYSSLAVSQWGASQFKVVRSDVLKTGKRSRKYVNAQMRRVLRFLKWAVGEGRMPAASFQACQCVAPLKRGRCEAPESPPIQSVPVERVEATLQHLTRVVADMVRFQLLTGCRPGEVCKITPGMVDRSGDVWRVELVSHKTAWRDKTRTIYVGPKAQEVLRPYLVRGADDYCFSPEESERQRLAGVGRATPLNCGNRAGYSPRTREGRKALKQPGKQWNTQAFGKSIKAGCERGKLPVWTPLQLRHTAATAIRKQFGLEAAQVILGHSELTVTQVYAEAQHCLAVEVVRKIG